MKKVIVVCPCCLTAFPKLPTDNLNYLDTAKCPICGQYTLTTYDVENSKEVKCDGWKGV